MTHIRFWALAPVAAVALAFFALYHWGHRKWGDSYLIYPWALTVGLGMGVMNVVWNFVSSLVFLRMPEWTNEDGELSPFFTTRLKAYAKEGYEPLLVQYLMRVINGQDPGHFDI